MTSMSAMPGRALGWSIVSAVSTAQIAPYL